MRIKVKDTKSAADKGVEEFRNLIQAKGKADYPPDHVAGMKVPEGGSNCEKCKYLKDSTKGLCGNKYFIAWNGSEKIPGKIGEYCSDWFIPASKN